MTPTVGPLDRAFIARSLTVAGVGFLSRAFFIAFAPFWAGDSADYHAIAANLVAGNGFGLTAASPTVFRPPVYPMLIAAIYAVAGPHPGFVLLVQAALGGLATWFVYLIGRRTVGERAGVIGASLGGAYPQLAFYAGTLLSETLSFFLLSAAFLAASHVRRDHLSLPACALAGALLGFAALSSPRFVAMPIAVLLGLALARVPLRRLALGAVIVLISYSAILTPWVVRNAREFGAPIVSTVGQAGLTLWLSAYRAAPYDYRYHLFAQTEPVVARYLALYTGSTPERERELIGARLTLEDDLVRDSLRRITQDPAGFILYRLSAYPALWIQPAAYAGYFLPPFTDQNDGLAEMVSQRHWVSAAVRVTSMVVFTGGLFGGVAASLWVFRRRLVPLALLWMPAAYVGLAHSVLLAEQRYSILAHPYLWLIAAAAFVELSRRLRWRRYRLVVDSP